MPPEENNHMQIAKDAFTMLSPDDRLMFIDWARKEADKDLYGFAREQREAFFDEVKEGLEKGAKKAEELGKSAVSFIKEAKGTLDDKLQGFLKDTEKRD